MRVLHVTNDFLDEVGGISRHIEEITSRQAGRIAVEILYLSLKRSASVQVDEKGRRISILPHSGRSLRRALTFPAKNIKSSLSEITPDIVHFHTPIEAARMEIPRGIPSVYTNHSSVLTAWGAYGSWMRPLVRAMLARQRKIICPSQYAARCTPHAECRVIPHGWPKPELRPRSLESRNTLLNRHQFVPERVAWVVASVGRLSPVKRIGPLLQANREFLQGSGQSIAMLIAGDGTEKKKLQAFVERNGLGNVRLLGECSSDSVYELLSVADVCVVPSRTETFGLVVLEAQASGCVPLVANRGALPELIAGGETGALIPKSLSFGEILTSRTAPAWNAWGNQCRKKVANHPTWEIVAKQTNNLYRELLSAPEEKNHAGR